MSQIRLLTIKFANEILPREIPLFRGAVNAALEKGHSILFHNHTDKGFRYSYPLIQYKRIGGKAAIVCLEEGTEAIGEFFNLETVKLSLGNNTVDFSLEYIKADRILVQLWQSTLYYKLNNWVPFNSDNYQKYLTIESITDKVVFLERLLVGNILSFLKGVGIFVEDKIMCNIISMKEPHIIYYKGIKLMSFDVEFRSNMSLPQLIGLGKGVSVGYGVLMRTKKLNNTHESDEQE